MFKARPGIKNEPILFKLGVASLVVGAAMLVGISIHIDTSIKEAELYKNLQWCEDNLSEQPNIYWCQDQLTKESE